MSDTYNRFSGARSTYAAKKPVRAATTANVTLSGFQVVDGVTYASTDDDAGYNMRILVKDQDDSTENGIYLVNSSDWTREKDFDGNTDYTRGTSVYVAQGTVNGGKMFHVTSSDPQDIGTNATTFTRFGIDHVFFPGDDVESAATVDLDSATGEIIDVTGVIAITGITLSEGRIRIVRFTGALTLTHSSTLVLPGSQNITTAAGDYAIFIGYSSSVVRCASYIPANSQPLITGSTTIASAATTELGSVREQYITISGTVAITDFGSTAPTGTIKHLTFSGSLTLTHDGTSFILPTGANIVTQSGDTAIVVHEGSGNWRIAAFNRYQPRQMLSVDTTETATTGSTAESDLLSYSLTASDLAADGYAVRVNAWGVTAATTMTKELKLYFGGTDLADTGALALNDLSWRFQSDIIRTSTAAQMAHTITHGSSATTLPSIVTLSTPGESLTTSSTAITIKVTAICESTAASEVTQDGLTVELVPYI